MSQFIATTPLFQMRALGSAAERSLSKVQDVMHREFRGGIRFELAEPVPRKDGTGIDWYTENDEPLTQLVKLPGELADQYRARLKSDLDTVVRSVQAYEARSDSVARATSITLRNAVTFPGEDNIWLAGNVDAGTATIILTGWGYERHQSEAAKPDIKHPDNNPAKAPFEPEVGLKIDQTPPPEQHLAAPATVVEPEMQPAARWRSLLAWLLGLITLLAALTIGWMLLPACGVKLPFGGPVIYGWGEGYYCRQAANPVAERDNSATQALLGEIASLENRLRDFILTCIPQNDRAEEERRAEETRKAEEAKRAQDDAERVLRDNGIQPKEGDTDVTLIWRNKNDIDLHVICPDGKQVPLEGTYCGARHKLDMNRNTTRLTDLPVEHVSWDDKALPPGHYKIVAFHYKANPPAPLATPYTLILHRNGEYKTFQGTLNSVKEAQTVVEFDIP